MRTKVIQSYRNE